MAVTGASGAIYAWRTLTTLLRSPDTSEVQLVVSDGGTVTCNGGKARALPGDELLEARQLARDLEAQAALSIELPKEKDSTLRYVVRTASGRVAFSDTSRGRPATFDRLVAFSKTVIEDVCKIRR